MSAASEQDPNLLTPSHPNEASPGRNDIVVATMHYGHKRMIFEKDVAIQVRDGTVCSSISAPVELEPGEIVPCRHRRCRPSSTLFRKGEALPLTAQGANFRYNKSEPPTHRRQPDIHARTLNQRPAT